LTGDTTALVSRMFFQILGAIAEFEHAPGCLIGLDAHLRHPDWIRGLRNIGTESGAKPSSALVVG